MRLCGDHRPGELEEICTRAMAMIARDASVVRTQVCCSRALGRDGGASCRLTVRKRSDLIFFEAMRLCADQRSATELESCSGEKRTRIPVRCIDGCPPCTYTTDHIETTLPHFFS